MISNSNNESCDQLKNIQECDQLKNIQECDKIMEYIENYENKENIENIENKIEDKTIIILGIDLGTTNSCISIWRNNNIEIIPDEFGNKTIPSYVSFTE